MEIIMLLKSNTEEVVAEDKYSKDLYDIYDARIFDKDKFK